VTRRVGRGSAGDAAARGAGAGVVRGPPLRSGLVAAGAERGAAVVELLVVFLALLVPLVYVMVVMADVQRALLATSSAAREAGRVYVTGSDRLDAERRAALAYREVLATYGMRPGDPSAGMRLRVACPAGDGSGPAVGSRPGDGSGCAGGFGPGVEVEVVVTYRVSVARVPFLGSVAGPGVTVGATHHTRVDRYRGLGG
jgi:Flp pilus assembly protein TadG